MKLHIPLPPAGFERPRPNPRGGWYSPHTRHYKDWHQLITNQMRLAGEHILEGPVSIAFHIGAESTDIEVLPVVGEQPRRPKGVEHDIDNLVKFNNDMLQQYTFFDDKQVVDLAARFKGT